MGYPVKYAVQRVMKEIYGRPMTMGYIASKCYVVDNSLDTEYIVPHYVAFPYHNIFRYPLEEYSDENLLNMRHRNKPFRCNARVSKLFDTFEEAKESANEMNDELKKERIFRSTHPIHPLDRRMFKEVDINLEFCKRYEGIIEANTEDMTITKDKCKIKNNASKN